MKTPAEWRAETGLDVDDELAELLNKDAKQGAPTLQDLEGTVSQVDLKTALGVSDTPNEQEASLSETLTALRQQAFAAGYDVEITLTPRAH